MKKIDCNESELWSVATSYCRSWAEVYQKLYSVAEACRNLTDYNLFLTDFRIDANRFWDAFHYEMPLNEYWFAFREFGTECAPDFESLKKEFEYKNDPFLIIKIERNDISERYKIETYIPPKRE